MRYYMLTQEYYHLLLACTHRGKAIAEIRIPILSPTIPTMDLIVKYCYILNGKPVYQSGVESTVTPELYHYAMGSACYTIDELPKVIDWVRTTRQCKQCHYSSDNSMHCGKGLVGDGYCNGYVPLIGNRHHKGET